jgi:hypothetical protein
MLGAPIIINLTGFESQFPSWYNNLRKSQKVKYKPITWTWDGVVKYMSDVEQWFNDNFGLRNELVKLNSLAYRCLNTSQNRDKYLIGKNGFLFKGNLSNNVVSISTGSTIYGTEELEEYYQYLEGIARYFKSRDIPLYMAIPPNKHTIYSEYLPDFLKMKKPTMYDQILAYEGNPLQIIDLREPLLEAKKKYGDLLYYKSDSHWSKLGAYIGYTCIMKEIEKDFPMLNTLELIKYDVSENTMGGDLAYNANLMNWVEDFSVDLTFDKPLDSLTVFHPAGAVYRTGPDEMIDLLQNAVVKNDEKPLKLLYMRDSFGKNLGYFMHHTFGTVVHLYILSDDTENIDEYIEKYDPDIVLFEFVERYLSLKTIDPVVLFDRDLYEGSETMEKHMGEEILARSNKRYNIQVISSDSNMLIYENISGKGSRWSFEDIACPDGFSLGIMVKLHSPKRTFAKLYYANGSQNLSEANSIRKTLDEGWNDVFFKVKTDSFSGHIRLDLGHKKGIYKLESIELRCLKNP